MVSASTGTLRMVSQSFQFTKQNSFMSGDVDPRFFFRDDISVYRSFCASTLNMYPVTSGAMTRRPGTAYYNALKANNNNIRLFDFVFNNQDFLLLEFGGNYIRFHKDSGTVQSGGSPYEVATAYNWSQIPDLEFAQLNDVVYIVHKDHPPRRLRRLADNNWTLQELSFRDGPYLDVNTTSTQLTLTVTTLPEFTVTANANVFSSSDVGRFLRVQIPSGSGAGLWFYGTITAFTSATEVTFEAVTTATSSLYPNGQATLDWRLGAFYTGNYPQEVTFYQNRLYLFKTPSHPSSGWASVVNEDFLFAPTQRVNGVEEITTTSAINFTLSSRSAASIQFAVGADTLLVGTESGLFSSATGTLTPSNFSLSLSSNIPLSDTSPLLVKGYIIAVSQLNNQVYSFRYSEEENSYTEQDLSVYWQHLFNANIRSIKYTSYPSPLIWFLMEDGTLLSMLFYPEQNSIGVTKHVLPDTEIIDIEVLPDLKSGFDRLWMHVKRRDVNSLVYLSKEYRSLFHSEDKPINARFLDYFLEYSGASVSFLSGLQHLAGEEVSYIGDGRVGKATVSSTGEVALGFEASNIAVGIPYDSHVTIMDAIFPQTVINSALASSFKYAHNMKVSMEDSLYCYAQMAATKKYKNSILPPVRYEISSTEDSSVVRELASGTTELKSIDLPENDRVSVKLWIDQPFPLTITGVSLAVSPTNM